MYRPSEQPPGRPPDPYGESEVRSERNFGEGRSINGGSDEPRRRNFDGAFPLLLVGSALLVCAGILANSELASKSGHLPLYGLVGVVGAVILGAGIYSTFLEPESTGETTLGEEWVAVPKAEWDALRSGARPTGRSAPAGSDPPWLERPEDRGIDSLVPAPVPASGAYLDPPSSTQPSPEVEGPTPTASALATLDELEAALVNRTKRPSGNPPRTRTSASSGGTDSPASLEAVLTDLEGLVTKDPGAPPGPVKEAAPVQLSVCVDCDRDMSLDRSPSYCEDCGRLLCVNCAFSSVSEDGELRCIECRVRKGEPGLTRAR